MLRTKACTKEVRPMWQSAALLNTQERPARAPKGESHAYRSSDLFVVVRNWIIDDPGSIPSSSCCGNLRSDRSSGFACVRPAHLPWTWLHLGSRLLGLRPGRLFLGSGHVGGTARSRSALDSGVLGSRRRLVRLVSGLLGT